jgi:hypothetical protein
MKRRDPMKRSIRVYAPLLAASALALAAAGCRPRPEMQRCVDEQNHVVPESFCQANGVTSRPASGYGGGQGYFRAPMYRFYYGGYGGWNPGSTVGGGSYTSVGGHSYTTSSGAAHSISTEGGTVRGGFGGSHGGEGGGHGGGE